MLTKSKLCTPFLAFAIAACAPPPEPKIIAAPKPPPPIVVEAPKQRPPPAPEWTYWEAIEVNTKNVQIAPISLPIAEKSVTRLGPDAKGWDALDPALKTKMLHDGFAVASLGTPRKYGDYYVHLRELGIPYVVTLDTLFHITHVAFERVLADLEWKTMAPTLAQMLPLLDARLTSESKNVASDLKDSYTMAREVVAVARALIAPVYIPSADIAEDVNAEIARVRNHIGPAKSDVAKTVIDYSAFAPEGDNAGDLAHAEYGVAWSWLSSIPFFVASRADVAGAPAGVMESRTQTRAAMILTRLLATNADPQISALYKQLIASRAIVFGHTDDVSPDVLARYIARAGVNLSDARSIANVVVVDRLRHALLSALAPEVYDGVAELSGDSRTSRALSRATLSVRLVGDEATADAATLSELVFPSIRMLSSGTATPPSAARDGTRMLPSSLDIAAWLGSGEARAELHDEHEDAFDGYDAALVALTKKFDADDVASRHATPYASFLDALAAYFRAAPADAFEPYAAGTTHRKMKLETALAYYATLRHDTLAFSRAPLDEMPKLLRNYPETAPPAAFVEAQPLVIAKLRAALAQLRRGLTHNALLQKDGVADKLLKSAEDMLRVAFDASISESNDQTFPIELAAELAYFPTMLAEWEALIDKTLSAEIVMTSDLHTDLGTARVRVLATGPIEALHAIVREPETGRAIHAVGAHAVAFEFIQPAALRLSDAAFRARLAAGSAPPRFAFTDAYRIAQAPASAPSSTSR